MGGSMLYGDGEEIQKGADVNRIKIDSVSHSLMPCDDNPLVEIYLEDGRIIRLEIESETAGSLMITYPEKRATFIDIAWNERD